MSLVPASFPVATPETSTRTCVSEGLLLYGVPKHMFSIAGGGFDPIAGSLLMSLGEIAWRRNRGIIDGRMLMSVGEKGHVGGRGDTGFDGTGGVLSQHHVAQHQTYVLLHTLISTEHFQHRSALQTRLTKNAGNLDPWVQAPSLRHNPSIRCTCFWRSSHES